MSDKFDELAQELARGWSRRDALRRIGGALAGVVLAGLGLPARASSSDPCCDALCAGDDRGGQGPCAKACTACRQRGQIVCTTSHGVACEPTLSFCKNRPHCG
jgi:hypothetical protein